MTMIDLPWWTPGEWDVPLEIPAMPPSKFNTPFMAAYRGSCRHFHDAQLIKDGRAVAAYVREHADGHDWEFIVTEPVSGAAVFHVVTEDSCPKTS